jgi:hypothetical protein
LVGGRGRDLASVLSRRSTVMSAVSLGIGTRNTFSKGLVGACGLGLFAAILGRAWRMNCGRSPVRSCGHAR